MWRNIGSRMKEVFNGGRRRILGGGKEWGGGHYGPEQPKIQM